MTATQLVTDPFLQFVLHYAAHARQQSLAILDVIASFHASSTPEVDNDQQLQLSRQQPLLTAYFAQLRGLNRKAILGARQTKQETAEARQEVDNLHLEPQNLYYEQRHLRSEIAACEDHEHPYEEIAMLPAEQYLALHPEHADSSEHELTEARIRDEHAQREALEAEKEALVKRKEGLVKETTAKKEELGKLDAEMEKWIAGEQAVRKFFEVRQKRMVQAS